MPSESRFLQDCLAEPRELRAILARLLGPQRAALEESARLLRAAPLPWIAGMGSSFHGGHAIAAFFDAAGLPVRNADAGELLHFAKLAPASTLLVLSRSGRSIEIVELLKTARSARATVIGVTWLGTVPLTNGLVAQIFGMRYAALLASIVFFGHQIGGFIGVWLAGYLFDTTGSYSIAFYASMGLGIFAAIVNLPVNEKPLTERARYAQAVA